MSTLAGKSVGLVTTTRVTHATPGGAYANVPERDWEGDSEVPASAVQGGCRDIARQLVEDYPDMQVTVNPAGLMTGSCVLLAWSLVCNCNCQLNAAFV